MSKSIWRTRGMILTGALVTAVALVGCSPSGQDGAVPSEAPSETSGSASPNASNAVPPTAAGEAVTADELGNLGKREGGKEGVTVTLNSVVANEGTMTVNFSMQNDQESGNIQVKDRFNNGIRDADSSQSTVDTFSADGVYVVTPEKKRYLVGRDADGICACSGNLANAFVNAGSSMTFSAVFAAPPADVTTVDVHIPTVGAFTSVELARP